jgi:hypothetical protein
LLRQRPSRICRRRVHGRYSTDRCDSSPAPGRIPHRGRRRPAHPDCRAIRPLPQGEVNQRRGGAASSPCNLDRLPLLASKGHRAAKPVTTWGSKARGRARANGAVFPSPYSRLGQAPAGDQTRLTQGRARKNDMPILVPKPILSLQSKTVALPKWGEEYEEAVPFVPSPACGRRDGRIARCAPSVSHQPENSRRTFSRNPRSSGSPFLSML